MTNPESSDPQGKSLVMTDDVMRGIDTLIARQMGVARFTWNDLEEIQANLGRRGFTHDERFNRSRSSADRRTSHGELHRHGVGQLIVHRTVEGSGPACFYWPAHDTYDFPYDEDLTRRRAEVDLTAGDVIIFPSQSWHQFGTDKNQARSAEWRHYYPPESQ